MEAPFWQLEHLSDQRLLERLQGVLHTKRRALAELIAHLGEVEERRLHLQAACGSLFSYCVQRLGMSEDEACRRIELARLARRLPVLFGELASGQLTLSVALLLKRVLTAGNHLQLIAAVRGASSQRASEILAAHFPSPDAPSRIRKLPEPVVARPAASAAPPPTSSSPSPVVPVNDRAQASLPQPRPPQACPSQHPTARPEAPRPGAGQRIEPLSAGRYRVQFTADANLKRKLEQARDLLRHAEPSGDFAAIVSRALDSLLEELMGRRFGIPRRERAAKPAHSTATSATAASGTAAPPPAATAAPEVAPDAAHPHPASSKPKSPRSGESSAPSRAARRAVVQRNGLGCSWVDATGHRCGNTAWLELDHRHPAGKGGCSTPDNLRLLCRAHHRFAAERAYGRAHVEQSIRARQQASKSAPARPQN